jgi:tetratricopeptide (TPR) repeat protein
MNKLCVMAAALIAASFVNIAAAQQISAAVAKPLKEASDLLQAGKAREAIAKLSDVTPQSPHDAYMIDRVKGAAYQKLGDNASAAKALESAFSSGRVPPNQAGQLAESVAYAYLQLKNTTKAQQWIDKARTSGDDSATLRELQAYVQTFSGDYGAIQREAQANISAAESAGRKPSEEDLLRLADAYRHTGNKAGDLQIKEKLATNYPTRQYVGIYLSDLRGKSGFSSRYRTDVLRLKLATGNMNGAEDYMELGQLLLQAGLPTEAKAVVDKGYDVGALGSGAEAARQQRLRDLANKSVAEEKASIDRREGAAVSVKDANSMVALGVEYASIGKYDKAIDLIGQGIATDKLKYPEDARLRLGLAMLHSGKNKANAMQVLRSVQGTDGVVTIAQLYAVTSSGR